MEKQVLVNESSLTNIADALRTVGGATRIEYRTEEVYLPITKISKTSNALSFTERNGGHSNSAAKFDVVTLEGAASLEVTIAYQTEGTQYDWVQVASGKYTTAPSTSTYPKKGGTVLTQETLAFPNTDTVTFYFKSDSTGNDYLGYYAEVIGYDADGNKMLEDTLSEIQVPYEVPNVFTPSQMGQAILDNQSQLKFIDVRETTTSFNRSHPATIDISNYIGTQDNKEFYLCVMLYSANITTSTPGGYAMILHYDGSGSKLKVVGCSGGLTANNVVEVTKILSVSINQGVISFATTSTVYVYAPQSYMFLFYTD